MKIAVDQVIALSASIGACFSAIATFLTVREMAKQRKASYRPELALSRIYIECTKDEYRAIPHSWTPQNVDDKSPLAKGRCQIPLRNVGFGTAKSVLVTWSFPFEAVTKQVNELAQRGLMHAAYTFEKGMLSLSSDNFGTRTSLWINQRLHRLDYVLPVGVQHEPTMLNIPDAYMEIVSALIFFWVKVEKDKEQELFPRIPPLIADFEFLDIGESKHKVSIELNFCMTMLAANGELVHGFLESKKLF